MRYSFDRIIETPDDRYLDDAPDSVTVSDATLDFLAPKRENDTDALHAIEACKEEGIE